MRLDSGKCWAMLTLALVVLCPLSGCGRRRTLSFDGKLWTATGEEYRGEEFAGLEGDVFQAGDEDERLLEMTPIPGQQGILTRVLVMQERHRKTWRNHGPQTVWFKDASRRESEYEEGLLEGTCTGWYADGQMAYREAWHKGKRHGLQEKWYKNGQKQREDKFVRGEKFSGKSWTHGGTRTRY